MLVKNIKVVLIMSDFWFKIIKNNRKYKSLTKHIFLFERSVYGIIIDFQVIVGIRMALRKKISDYKINRWLIEIKIWL